MYKSMNLARAVANIYVEEIGMSTVARILYGLGIDPTLEEVKEVRDLIRSGIMEIPDPFEF